MARSFASSARAMASSWTASFGVALMGPEATRDPAGWARAAERSGLGSLWVVEDYFHPGAFEFFVNRHVRDGEKHAGKFKFFEKYPPKFVSDEPAYAEIAIMH